MRKKVRVRDPKDAVLRVRVSSRTHATLKKLARSRTKGKISALARHYILEGLKRERKNVLR